MYEVSGCVCKKPNGKFYVSLWWFEGKERFRKNVSLSPDIAKKSEAQHELNKIIIQKESQLKEIAGRHELHSVLASVSLPSLFSVKPNTLYKYDCILKKYRNILEELDHTFYLESITPNDFELFFQYLAEYQHQKVATIKSDKAFLHKLFDKLIVCYGLTRNNPVSLADLNKIRFDKVDQQDKRIYMTDEEIVGFNNFLLSSDKYSYLSPIFKLCITFGIRRSECLGLLWENIDFNTNTIYIRHTRIKGFKGEIIGSDSTKTKKSCASYPISEDILDTLQQLEPQPSGYVFTDKNNKPFAPDYVSHDFKKAIKEFGLPEYMSFKTTRSTCACRLIEKHCTDSEIILYMRHESVSTTRKHYMECTNNLKKEMLEKTSIAW